MSGAGSDVVLRVDPAGRRGPLQGGEVGLRLVGIRCGEVRDGLVEDVPATEVRGDGDPVPGPGMRPGQRLGADLRIRPEAGRGDPVVSSDPFQSWSWRT